MRIFWMFFAAAVLVASFALHVSTFLGIDPMERFPHVMLVHVLIFPPFIAAIFALSKTPAAERRTPRWMKVYGALLGVYAIITGALFLILGEGGGPHELHGKFFLMEHGMVLRELTRAEFHQQQAYVVRFFSTGWMLFSSIALGGLIVAHRPLTSTGTMAAARPNAAPAAEAAVATTLPPAQITRASGFAALLIYLSCVTIILARQPLFNVLCIVPFVTFTIIALRRRTLGFPHGQFDTTIGCLSVVPNFFLAVMWMNCVRQFTYVAFYAGLASAVHGTVQIVLSRTVPAHLSNGQLLHTGVWSALFIPGFLLMFCGLVGLTYMGEQIGRLFRAWQRTP